MLSSRNYRLSPSPSHSVFSKPSQIKQAARLLHILFLVLTTAVVGRTPSHVLPGGRDPGDGRGKGGVWVLGSPGINLSSTFYLPNAGRCSPWWTPAPRPWLSVDFLPFLVPAGWVSLPSPRWLCCLIPGLGLASSADFQCHPVLWSPIATRSI